MGRLRLGPWVIAPLIIACWAVVLGFAYAVWSAGQ